jgi:site-specific DNA-methyltransferase (adenine-specific)
MSNSKIDNDVTGRFVTEKQNFHPTVKPIELMSYLITLGSREGDLVVDPFVGSGTTCIAAKMLERNYVGIEKEEDYILIANERIKATNPTDANKSKDFFQF